MNQSSYDRELSEHACHAAMHLFNFIPVLEETIEEAQRNLDLREECEHILECYNTLREAFDFPPAASLAEADPSWLRWQHYQLWKEPFQAALTEEGVTSIDQQSYLVTELAKDGLAQFRATRDKDHGRLAVYYYNLLRELADLAPVDLVQEIDESWMRERDYQLWRETISKELAEGEEPASLEEQKLLMLQIIESALAAWHAQNERIYELKEALYFYRLLREREEKLPPVTSALDIDMPQLKVYHYEVWKEAERQFWQESDITTIPEQKITLLEHCLSALEDLEKDPNDADIQRSILHGYNFFREYFQLPPLVSPESIDKQQLEKELDTEYYTIWKDDVQVQTTWPELSCDDRQRELFGLAFYALDTMDNGGDADPYDALYPYNFIREQLQLPAAPSREAIDIQWLRNYVYELWKAGIKRYWRSYSITTPVLQRYNLAQWTADSLKEWKKDPRNRCKEKEALYKYNFLRELLRLPLIASSKEFEPQWLQITTHELREALYS
jgi:hypothetical protein